MCLSVCLYKCRVFNATQMQPCVSPLPLLHTHLYIYAALPLSALCHKNYMYLHASAFSSDRWRVVLTTNTNKPSAFLRTQALIAGNGKVCSCWALADNAKPYNNLMFIGWHIRKRLLDLQLSRP